MRPESFREPAAYQSSCACPPFSLERFFLNVDHVGNTSSASIPLALMEVEERLHAGDKLVLCSVGAGMTTAAISVEW